MLAIGADALKGIQRLLTQRFIETLLHQLGVAQNGSERGSELMAHIGDELALVLAGDLKLPALLGDLAEQASVLHRDGGLGSEGLDEPNDLLGELAWVVASDN